MPLIGSRSLPDLKAERLEVSCDKRRRRGSYVIAALIKRLGPDGRLTDLLCETTWDCPRRGQQAFLDQCGAHFSEAKTGVACAIRRHLCATPWAEAFY